MNWDGINVISVISTIVEVFGAVAILITLFYLATQIRRSNELTRFNSAKEIVNQFNDLNRMVVSDSQLRRVLMKHDEISADEREQIYNFTMMFCNVWMSVQAAYDNDQIDYDFYAAGAKDVLIELDRWPNFRSAAEQWLTNYPENKNYSIFKPIVREEDENGESLIF